MRLSSNDGNAKDSSETVFQIRRYDLMRTAIALLVRRRRFDLIPVHQSRLLEVDEIEGKHQQKVRRDRCGLIQNCFQGQKQAGSQEIPL